MYIMNASIILFGVQKYRRKKLYGRLRQRFGEIMHNLCHQKDVDLIQGHACLDYVYMCL